VAQALYIQQLAERIGIAEKAVSERIGDVLAQKSKVGSPDNRPAISADPRHPIGFTESAAGIERPRHVDTGNRFERQIIAMMLQFSDILPDINKLNVLKYFENEALKHIGELILKYNLTSGDQVSELMSRVDSEAQQILIASLAMGDESWNMKGCLRLLGKFVESGEKIRDSGLLEGQIKAAEKSNDHDLLLKLLNQKQKMAERSEKQKMAILSEK
jgi:hypothetical protein